MTGHKTIAEAEPYLRDISRSSLAEAGIALLDTSPKPEQNVVNLTEEFAKKLSKPRKRKIK